MSFRRQIRSRLKKLEQQAPEQDGFDWTQLFGRAPHKEHPLFWLFGRMGTPRPDPIEDELRALEAQAEKHQQHNHRGSSHETPR